MTRRRRSWATVAPALVAAFVLLVLPVWAAGAVASPVASGEAVSPAIVAPDSLYAGPFSERAGYNASYGAQVAGARPATGTELAVVTFETPNPALFDAPASNAPALSMTQVANEFGLSPAKYAAVEQYFESQGLSIAHTWPDRLALTVEGTSSALDAAFGTTLESGTFQGRDVTYPASPPSLPAAIESLVAGVTGLSSGFTTFSVPLTPEAEVASQPAQSSTPVTPAIARNNLYDISGLYNLTTSPTYATAESLAVILWGDGYSPTDLSTFWSEYYPTGFPVPTVNAYPVDGAPEPSAGAVNDPDHSAPQELTLDIEWSGSMAAGATIDAVYAPDGPASNDYSPTSASMVDALNEAISLKPDAISMSFGTAESGDAGLRAGWDTAFAAAVQSGITILAATGDLGGDAGSGCTGGPSPEYPSTNPDVLAVGGTDVDLQTNLLGQVTGFSESAWGMGGGGFSTYYPAPSWQTAAIPSAESGGDRGIPDVSATAAYNMEYYNGASVTAGGTSFATPLWAGLVVEMDALHGKPLGLLSPRLYSIGLDEPSGKIGQGLAGITTGSNCVASAGPGWNAATGWGSPRGVTLYEELTATFVNLSIGSSAPAIPPGGTVTITAHLANESTGAAIANVPVSVSLSADTDLGPCVGSFGLATPATDVDGNVSVAITVPYCYLGAHAIAEVQVTSDALYGTNSTSIGVDLLAFAPFLEGITTYPSNVVAYVGLMAIAIAVGALLGYRREKPHRPVRYAAAGSGPAPTPTPPAAASGTPSAGPPAEPVPPAPDDAPPPLPEPAPES